MGSPHSTPHEEDSHPGQTFCPLCPSGGAWRPTPDFYVRRSGQSPAKKRVCASCRQQALVARLAGACARYFRIDAAKIDSPTRGTLYVAQARQSLMLLLHESFGWTHYRIAKVLHRDHRTVSHGITQARAFLTPAESRTILQLATQEKDRLAS